MSWGEYRQADFLKENLKYKMDWIVKAHRYKKLIEIEIGSKRVNVGSKP